MLRLLLADSDSEGLEGSQKNLFSTQGRLPPIPCVAPQTQEAVGVPSSCAFLLP